MVYILLLLFLLFLLIFVIITFVIIDIFNLYKRSFSQTVVQQNTRLFGDNV